MTATDTIVSRLKAIVGDDGVSVDAGDLEHWGRDWTRFYEPRPLAVVFPKTIEQTQQFVRLARELKLDIVPSGGRTGLSGGACATRGELVISFDRMNRVISFSETDSTVTVQPGLVTAALQQFAAAHDRFYPVDFASSGSSQIGGNIATNAGGIRVIRYGMTRDQVAGLKVVTGTGELLELNRGLTKNNTGYDLRHLFVGSEGTLGLIVEATIALLSPPADATVMLLAVPRMEDTLAILNRFRARVTLNAFEFFSDLALQHVLASSDLAAPFSSSSPYYVLLEFEQASEADLALAMQAFEHCTDESLVTDGIVGSSGKQNAELWQYRERISESITPHTPYKNDISVRISEVPDFLQAIDALVAESYPDFEIVWFGHIGDGNLHLNILKPGDRVVDQFKKECEIVSEKILALVRSFGGSISAEHGVGLLKRDQLHFSRTPSEIEAMRAIKMAFDPDGIMNPGKVI